MRHRQSRSCRSDALTADDARDLDHLALDVVQRGLQRERPGVPGA